MPKMSKIRVRPRPSCAGTTYYLDYSYQGRRYRDNLGDNLTEAERIHKASAAVTRIHATPSVALAVPAKCVTLEDFKPTFWKAFKLKGRIDSDRPGFVLDKHLKAYAQRPLSDLNTQQAGIDYLSRRIDELVARKKATYERRSVTVTPELLDEAKRAAAGTVEREWQIINRLINLAVDCEVLDRNRIKNIELPDTNERNRIPERWELVALHDVGGPGLWKAIVAAMNTGLREAKVLEAAEPGRITQEGDGYWLRLEKCKSKDKGNPEWMPLNRWAYESLKEGLQWNSAERLSKFFAEKRDKAGIKNLHFHDLRHLFTTMLQNLKVPYEVRQHLLGHTVKGTTAKYSHGSALVTWEMHEWDIQLREAVTKLEDRFNPTILSQDLSPEVKQISQHA